MLPNLILLPYYYKRENIVCIKLVLAQREERRTFLEWTVWPVRVTSVGRGTKQVIVLLWLDLK